MRMVFCGFRYRAGGNSFSVVFIGFGLGGYYFSVDFGPFQDLDKILTIHGFWDFNKILMIHADLERGFQNFINNLILHADIARGFQDFHKILMIHVDIEWYFQGFSQDFDDL